MTTTALSGTREEFNDRLIAHGLAPIDAGRRANVLTKAADRLEAMAPSSQETPIAFFVPGRVEFLGKHTDYAGGRSLLCAVERGIGIVASPRPDRIIRVANPNGGAPITFEFSAEMSPTARDWSNYAMTVARRLAMNFPGRLRGMNIAFESNLPPAAGLSSSSALVVAFHLVLDAINDVQEHPAYRQNIRTCEDLAGYLGTIENGQSFGTLAGDRGVGTFGGSEDHTAILCAKPDMLRQYAFCPVRAERNVAIPRGYVLAIGVSGVVAEKTGDARTSYNAVSLAVTAILDRWRRATGRNDATLAAALKSNPQAALQLRQLLESANGSTTIRLIDRLEQFIAESEQIIPAAGDALAAGKIDALGTLVDRSQELGARLLSNQVDETIYLARAARHCGAVAASAFGAGFGGSVWAMIDADTADDFLARWRECYAVMLPATKARPTFFLTTASRPAFRI